LLLLWLWWRLLWGVCSSDKVLPQAARQQVKLALLLLLLCVVGVGRDKGTQCRVRGRCMLRNSR
jgi:hypothetical protein